MTQQLSVKIEREPPPAPKRKPPPPPEKTAYPFDLIPIGGAGRFPRAANTVKNRLSTYRKLPGNEKKKFIIRPITPGSCRVWRTA